MVDTFSGICDTESFRRLQNLRLLEIHEKYIKHRLNDLLRTTEILDRIFTDFRNQIEAFCLPLPDPALSRSDKPTFGCTAADEDGSALSNLALERLKLPSETIRSFGGEMETLSQDSTRSCLGPVPAGLIKSVVIPMKRQIVQRLLGSVEQVVTERWATEEEIDDSDSSDDSYFLVSAFDESEQSHTENVEEYRTNMDNQPSQDPNSNSYHGQGQPNSEVNLCVGQGKRRADDPGSNDGNERGGGKRQRQERGENGTSVSEKKFSCPYYKHNPQRPRRNTSCRFPGFRNVSRVK